MSSSILLRFRSELLFAFLCYSLLASGYSDFSNCYLPPKNGSDINTLSFYGQIYVPCQNFQNVSGMCCSASDRGCTSDGLCVSPKGSYFRDACTDPQWGSSCASLFVDEVPNGTPSLTRCDDGSYCLWNNATGVACCNAGNGVFIAADGSTTNTKPETTFNVFASRTAVSTVTATRASVTTTVTASPSAVASGLSSGGKAATAVGVILGAALLVTSLFLLYQTRKYKQERRTYKQEHAHQSQSYSRSMPTEPGSAYAPFPSSPKETINSPVYPESLNNPVYQLHATPRQNLPYELEHSTHTTK